MKMLTKLANLSYNLQVLDAWQFAQQACVSPGGERGEHLAVQREIERHITAVQRAAQPQRHSAAQVAALIGEVEL